MIHLDIKKLGRFERAHRITGDRTGQSNSRGIGWEFVHVAIDDASRLAFSQIMPDEKKQSATAFLKAPWPTTTASASPSPASCMASRWPRHSGSGRAWPPSVLVARRVRLQSCTGSSSTAGFVPVVHRRGPRGAERPPRVRRSEAREVPVDPPGQAVTHVSAGAAGAAVGVFDKPARRLSFSR